MTETPIPQVGKISPEGRERLESPKNFQKKIPKDFNFPEGKIELYPLGPFRVLLLDPRNGEIVPEEDARQVITETEEILGYAPMVNEEEGVLLVMEWGIPDGRKRLQVHFLEFKGDRWQWMPMEYATIVDFEHPTWVTSWNANGPESG